jgi:Ca-activated chloride channel family protein
MKIDCQLDYQTILSNLAQPVHLVVRLKAAKSENARTVPLAFCVVLDRSGSMDGPPIAHAKKACEIAVQNLRPDDLFSLVVFDTESQVLVPLQKVQSKSALIEKIRGIDIGGSTNLTGGWMLGQDELKKAPQEARRRLLLLTDGELNCGIVDPDQVNKIVASGLERARVRTSCLGFGDHYNEVLLKDLAKVSGGDFYDADSPEKLPVIFKNELEGLQRISSQNVRLRFKRLGFCERWGQLSDYPVTHLSEDQVEISVGDLVSEEDRVVVLAVEVLPLPLINGQPVASLEGESLLEMEALWDEIGEQEIVSSRHEQLIRIQGTQDPNEIKLNHEVVAWIAVQRAGKTVEEATQDANANRVDAAKQKLQEALDLLKKYELAEKTADGEKLLGRLLAELNEIGHLSERAGKNTLYSASYYRKGSTARTWAGQRAAKPAFSQVPSVSEQLDSAEPTSPNDKEDKTS